MKCTQRLYLTADRKKVVAEGDKKAATLYAVPGDEIPESAHEHFHLVDGHLKGFDPSAVQKVEEPAPPPPATVIATQTLYHSSAHPDSLVGEDDPAADTLYANVGDEIPKTAHDGFGLVDGHLPDFDPEFDAKAKLLAAKADEDLERVEALGADKGGGSSSGKEQKGGSDKEQKGGSDKKQEPDEKTQTGTGAGDGADAGGAAQAGRSGETV